MKTDTMNTDKTTALSLLAAEQESSDLLAQLEGCRAERDELLRKLTLCREALEMIERIDSNTRSENHEDGLKGIGEVCATALTATEPKP